MAVPLLPGHSHGGRGQLGRKLRPPRNDRSWVQVDFSLRKQAGNGLLICGGEVCPVWCRKCLSSRYFLTIPERIRTSNLWLRRPTLCPIELRGRKHISPSIADTSTIALPACQVFQRLKLPSGISPASVFSSRVMFFEAVESQHSPSTSPTALDPTSPPSDPRRLGLVNCGGVLVLRTNSLRRSVAELAPSGSLDVVQIGIARLARVDRAGVVALQPRELDGATVFPFPVLAVSVGE